MANEKAMYWLAVGVAALGLNSALQNQEVQWAQNLASRGRASVERIAEHGLDYAVMAETMLGRNPASSPRLQAALGRLQAKTACVQAELARQQAERDILQARREMFEARKVDLRNQRHVMRIARLTRFDGNQHFEISVPDMPVNPADVQEQLRPMMQHVQDMAKLRQLQGMEALRNLPNVSSSFVLTDTSDVPTPPEVPVHMQILLENQSDANGPI